MSSDVPVNEVEAAHGANDSDSQRGPSPGARGRWLKTKWLLLALVLGVLLVDAVAYLTVPPFDPKDTTGTCQFPVCFINGNFEFPAPATVFGTAPENGQILTWAVGISSTILTMWIIGGAILLAAFLLGRLRKDVPGRIQNFSEWVYESLYNFGVSIGGPPAAAYVPIFASFFLLILLCNWAGLVPPVGKLEFLRAPTSDVNVTIGLALVSFFIFQGEGFRKLGVRGYLGKFFPFYEFKNGIGAGAIALFVGLIELMLEFVKPLTLSMRLFGNIYAGEVAIGVITSLTVVFAPVLLLLLEGMLNLIQAIIFSVLTLVFILSAIESHHEEEGHIGEEAADILEGHQPQPAGAPETPEPSPSARPSVRAHAGGSQHMEHIGAGLAAIGVIGPGIGIGILGGLATSAIGRNPDAAGQIRGLAIILAGFAEGLGVLAIVVGLLTIFIS